MPADTQLPRWNNTPATLTDTQTGRNCHTKTTNCHTPAALSDRQTGHIATLKRPTATYLPPTCHTPATLLSLLEPTAMMRKLNRDKKQLELYFKYIAGIWHIVEWNIPSQMSSSKADSVDRWAAVACGHFLFFTVLSWHQSTGCFWSKTSLDHFSNCLIRVKGRGKGLESRTSWTWKSVIPLWLSECEVENHGKLDVVLWFGLSAWHLLSMYNVQWSIQTLDSTPRTWLT